jgi:hypothetical protein
VQEEVQATVRYCTFSGFPFYQAMAAFREWLQGTWWAGKARGSTPLANLIPEKSFACWHNSAALTDEIEFQSQSIRPT